MASFVVSHEPAVDPDVGAVVDRAEMEQESLAAVFRSNLDRPPVPDNRVIPRVTNTAGLRLRRKRHHHSPIERIRTVEPAVIQPGIVVVIGKRPRTAQVDPTGAGELRARVEITTGHGFVLLERAVGSGPLAISRRRQDGKTARRQHGKTVRRRAGKDENSGRSRESCIQGGPLRTTHDLRLSTPPEADRLIADSQ